ncbi:hypothetical protein E2C01_067519 [Portunus trituberculatus]|uniref:Uncharacterized protein n=1 Tax=Portunus trituberculatus TaxID=210409 RepID=A0A5B7HWX8_PORTR|nr:hypothetical protein [Portunus trituberculatus]
MLLHPSPPPSIPTSSYASTPTTTTTHPHFLLCSSSVATWKRKHPPPPPPPPRTHSQTSPPPPSLPALSFLLQAENRITISAWGVLGEGMAKTVSRGLGREVREDETALHSQCLGVLSSNLT